MVSSIGEGNVDLPVRTGIRSARSPAGTAGTTTAVDDNEDDDLPHVVNDPSTVVGCVPEVIVIVMTRMMTMKIMMNARLTKHNLTII